MRAFLFSFAVLCLGWTAGCSSLSLTSPRSQAVPEQLVPGTILRTNTGEDVKTFTILNATTGRFHDYFGNRGIFTFQYAKTAPKKAEINTTWKTSNGNSGQSQVYLRFRTAAKGYFKARETLSDGRKARIYGRFTLRPPQQEIEFPSMDELPTITPPTPGAPVPIATPKPSGNMFSNLFGKPAPTPTPTPAATPTPRPRSTPLPTPTPVRPRFPR